MSKATPDEQKQTRDAMENMQAGAKEFSMDVYQALVKWTGVQQGVAYTLVFQLPNGQLSMHSNLQVPDSLDMVRDLIDVAEKSAPSEQQIISINRN